MRKILTCLILAGTFTAGYTLLDAQVFAQSPGTQSQETQSQETQSPAAAPSTKTPELPLNQQTARPAKKWITEGVMYQINPRAFTPEGTLKAAEGKLRHIADLGVTIVYLCPVFVADDDMNREFWSPRQKKSGMENPRNPYRMKDFYHVDPEYGTDADLKSFIDTAHSLGLRVMLDMVYVHRGPTAVLIDKDPNFVKRDKNGKIITEAWKYPALNFASPKLREYLFANMEQWVGEYGVDGFRMDVADRIPLDFWEETRVRLEKLDPEIGLLSEGTRWRDQLKAFDLNYSFPIYGFIRRVYDEGLSAKEIRGVKERFRAQRPIGGDRVIHYIDNHDISNDDYENRVEKRWTEKGVNAMLAMMFTLDGTPMLYCGQEICDKNRHSIFGSKFGCKVDWGNADSDEAKRRTALIRQLAAERKVRPELTAGKLIWLDNSAEDDVLTYMRVLGEKQTFVAVNVRGKAVSFDAILPDGTQKHVELDAWGFLIE